MTTAATEHLSAVTVWLGRLRFLLATAGVWTILHYVGSGFVLPPGLDRPLVLSAGPTLGPLGGLLVVLLIWIGTALAGLVLWPGTGRTPLMAVGLALALWAAEGGQGTRTIDDWLILQNELPGSPAGAAYWRLLPDYLYLIIAVVGAFAIAAVLRPSAAPNEPLAARLHREFAPPAQTPLARGLAATLITTVVAGVGVLFLIGSSAADTYRGQVYFAVAVGLLLGVFAARHIVKVHDAIWFWPVPLLLGVIGLVVAGVRPALQLAPEYQHLGMKPAWGLCRPLPVEMVGVGLVATLMVLRAPGRPASADDPS